MVSLSAAGCAPPTSVTFTGRGFGHGRGMGQWGALGYTVDHGWSGTQVLNHFYGGTTMATVASGGQRVYLTGTGGQELRVVQTYGRLRVDGYSGNLTAVRVARLGPGRFRIWGGSSCTGGWIHITDRTTPQVNVRSGVLQGNDPTRMMQRCTTTGSTRYYRGSMYAVDALGTIVSVNELATEAMLRSVVAREVSPSWSDHGGGRGAAAVRAQAVAARSYLLSGDTRWSPWATTCDSPASCQVYEGYGTRAAGGTTITKVEDPRTDAGVSTTANQVRVFTGTIRIARTEFSSSRAAGRPGARSPPWSTTATTTPPTPTGAGPSPSPAPRSSRPSTPARAATWAPSSRSTRSCATASAPTEGGSRRSAPASAEVTSPSPVSSSAPCSA